MKKYKHKSGKIAVEYTFHYTVQEVEIVVPNQLPKWVVENSCDWEEIIDKPSFIVLECRLNNLPVKLLKNGHYGSREGVAGSNLQNTIKNGFKIYSVRKENGQVFTIGDKIWDLGKIKTITEFELEDKIPTWKTIGVKFEHGASDLSITHKIFPVLTTKDGVDLYEGDSYYFTWIKQAAYGQSILTPYYVKALSSLDNDERMSEDAAFFKSLEKCEEYIVSLKPKPMFISSDGVEIFKGMDVWIYRTHLKNTYNHSKPLTINCWTPIEGEITFSTRQKLDEYLESLKPKPLFTTEDGVDVTEKRTKLWIVQSNFKLIEAWIGKENDSSLSVGMYVYRPESNKYFHFKERAEEFILMNKPCLSLKDVNNLCKTTKSIAPHVGRGCYDFTTILDTHKLEELVKSKL